MTQAQEIAIRNQFLDFIMKAISDGMEIDGRKVKANEVTFPCMDSDNNEAWVNITIKVPRGTRNGKGGYDPYDGDFEADEYEKDCAEKAEKKRLSEEKKQAKIAADEKKRAEKKALKEANEGLKELHNIKVTPERE